MRRQVKLVWGILGTFLLFFLCLPLDCKCLDHIITRQITGGHAAPSISADHNRNQKPFQKDGVCQACLWYQSLHLRPMAVEFVVARTVSAAPACILIPTIAHTDFFRSASKRAPPSQSIL